MLGGWLHQSCDSLARVVFPSCWVLPAIFFPSRPSPRPVGFFLHWCSSVWQVPVPFLCCGGSWLGCTVVPVMGALFHSRGWLPIVEAPGYFRHPTSILATQLLIRKLLLFILCNTIPCIYKCLTAHLKCVHVFNLINYLLAYCRIVQHVASYGYSHHISKISILVLVSK